MKLLLCLFLVGVSCMERKGKSREYMIGHVCPKCHFFERFNREMAEGEDEFFEEVERHRVDFCVVCARKLDAETRSQFGNICLRCVPTLES